MHVKPTLQLVCETADRFLQSLSRLNSQTVKGDSIWLQRLECTHQLSNFYDNIIRVHTINRRKCVRLGLIV